jgi:predicted transcriptional regulator
MRKTLGDQEMQVLAFVLEREPISHREAADHFALSPLGLARTTVHTILERLRAKGYLVRESRDEVLKYRGAIDRKTLLEGLVKQFVTARLGGSISPLVAYLCEAKNLTDVEIEQLCAAVNRLGKEA